jgi:hypothetical protein
MLFIRFLFFALSIVVASAVIAERQLPSIHTVVSDLAIKVGAATSQIRTSYFHVRCCKVLRKGFHAGSISSKGQETDTKIGDLINQIDNYLNRAISDLQNLKNAPAPPTQSGRPKRTIADRYARVSVQQKRQTAYEVQSLQARVVIVCHSSHPICAYMLISKSRISSMLSLP